MAKLADKKKKNTIQKSRWIKEIINYYIIAVFCIFPVIFDDKYFNILATKYTTYWVSTVAMAAVIALGAVVSIFFCIMLNEKNDIMNYFENFSFKRFIKSFTVTDTALIIFLITAVISTLQSDYSRQAWTGSMGRHTGLFLLLIYGAAYFILSRGLKLSGWHINIFLIIGLFVAVFGITDYFKMDLLKFKVLMDDSQKDIFTSTIGNINTYTAYIGMVMAVASVLFFNSEKDKWYKQIFYYICMAVSIMALILGQSDNAYLSFIAFCGLVPFYLFWHKEGIKRYIIFIATFFSITEIINIINIIFADKVLELHSAFNIIIEIKWLPVLITLLWIIIAVWYVIDKKKTLYNHLEEEKRLKWPVIVWLAICIAVFATVIMAAYDCNVHGNAARYGELSSYLVFNDDWGSHRGYIWSRAISIYKDFPPLRKIVGYGPDTFLLMMQPFKEESRQRYNEVFDSVHNEYLQYLVTLGAAGLISYLVFITSSIFESIKKAKDNPYVMACAFAVICYAAQALVSINLPIATPVMWTLLMCMVAGTRCSRTSENK